MSDARPSRLIIDVKHGERLTLSGAASVELMHKSGHLVRLRVTADPSVRIEKTAQDVANLVPSMTGLQPS